VNVILRIVMVLALCLSITVYAQFRIDAKRANSADEELLYLPNEKLLSHFTAGQSSLIADLLWLRCIQYTTKEFNRDHKFTWLEQMCNVITDLDPYFSDVYRHGGMFLACMKGDDDASLHLLDKGIANNPDKWELMWEGAMVYLLNRRNEPGSPEMAAKYLAMAELTGQAPERLAITLDGLSRKHGLYAIERGRWSEAMLSGDSMIRQMAERKLAEVDIREITDKLNEAFQQYTKLKGTSPNDLSDLVSAGLISHLPEDKLGGRFFIKDGKVLNTTLLDSDLEARRRRLQAAIDKFMLHQGRPPESLEELKNTEFLILIPDHPYGRMWDYDPKTGKVRG
jgi:hypothetical protein